MDELRKLEEYLKANKIEYKRFDVDKDIWALDRHQIIVYENGKKLWDAICQSGSYGYEECLLEVMGEAVVRKQDGDDVCGYLTAEEVIERYEQWRNAND